jgi:predicted NAD-dependent protein-ADP-ribosyltransferase YbiA (DUF1768 family)
MAELAEMATALVEGIGQEEVEVEGAEVLAEQAAATVVKKTAKKAEKAPKGPTVGVDKKLKSIKYPKSLTTFLRARDKNPQYFPFTPDGQPGTTLIFDDKGTGLRVREGPPVKIEGLELSYYTSISREDIDTLWAERQAKFDEIYEAIEAARTDLRNALAAYQAGTGTVRAVVIANQLVADKEASLIENRSAKRWVEMIPNPDTNAIELANRYETRKLGFDVYQMKQYAIDPQKLVRVVTPEEFAAGKVVAGGGEVLVYGVITDDTLLGLHWPADVKVGNTQYFTAFQAILGEAARGNQELFQSILGTRSSRTLRTLTKDFDATTYTSEILQSVITALSKQYPEFKELLLKTGDESLVYANIMDPIFSAGLEADDPNIQDTKQWRGENLWGQALEKARTEFREQNVTSKPEEEGVSIKDMAPIENAVISKEQQDSAKKAAIINARRFHRNH